MYQNRVVYLDLEEANLSSTPGSRHPKNPTMSDFSKHAWPTESSSAATVYRKMATTTTGDYLKTRFTANIPDTAAASPTPAPTNEPTRQPTGQPTPPPTDQLTPLPSKQPTSPPTPSPTSPAPTPFPTNQPTRTLSTRQAAPLSPGDSSSNVSPIAQANSDEKNHWREKSVLDLLPWEQHAYQGLTQPGVAPKVAYDHCKPPPGIPRSCCVGSFSAGGALSDVQPHRCNAAMKEFPLLRQHALQWFEENDSHIQDTKCDVCKIVEIVLKHNISLSFLGDSMHHQIFDGFTCELYRRGYQVNVTDVRYPVTEGSIYQQPHHNKTIRIRSPHGTIGDNEAVIHYHQMYKLPSVNDGLVNITGEADVLVTSFGLHWGVDLSEDYTIQMAELFRAIRQQGRVKLLVHRETSAQHWHADGGEYSLWWPDIVAKNLSQQCQPFELTDSTAGWREQAIREAANRSGHTLVMAGPHMPTTPSGQPELVILPYFNFTSQHPMMHPRLEDRDDCTHYCSSPFVYYPLWRSLRYTLDRHFG
ncbi:expressed unknown protein [Seminavis robusta]|uniref:Uncharacterized protein n=1 Tax=Seminavis robusta TaxID=568900 RepID=A0A9N8DFT1_9STRA|nr:expressed unknown protein [Seminavis robusta]|eukprot:Sro120_g058580.1 n/a (530) ;mRNA; r:76848-78532